VGEESGKGGNFTGVVGNREILDTGQFGGVWALQRRRIVDALNYESSGLGGRR
jgi:hypothetical protein